jgi:hypothetical protein
MNHDQLTTVTVALACFLAVGVAATTLSSSVTTDPSEALEPDYSLLPIGSDDVATVQEDIEANGDRAGDQDGRDDDDGGTAATTGNGDERGAPWVGPPGDAERGDRDSETDGEADGGDGDSGDDGVAGGGGRSGPGWADTSSVPPWALALLVVAVVLALGYRFRRHLRGLLPDSGHEPTREHEDAGPWRADAQPGDNEVYRAWMALVRRAELEDPHVRTTAECASAARRAGMDPDAVDRLRAAFEEVRYGKRPVTESRRREVARIRGRLQLDTAGDGT